MDAYIDAMRRYATFRGRSTRAQYWLFTLVYIVLLLVASLLDYSTGLASEDGGGVLSAIVVLVHFIPAISVTVRRLHDIDRTGWWYWIVLLPLAGFIVMLIFTCTRSTPGVNRFGPPEGNGVAAPSAPGAPFAATVRVAGTDDTLARLEKLSRLRDSGALDEAEFQRLKAEILAGRPA